MPGFALRPMLKCFQRRGMAVLAIEGGQTWNRSRASAQAEFSQRGWKPQGMDPLYYGFARPSIAIFSLAVICDGGFMVIASAGHSRAQKRQAMHLRAGASTGRARRSVLS